jgi:hypothetical protein
MATAPDRIATGIQAANFSRQRLTVNLFFAFKFFLVVIFLLTYNNSQSRISLHF